MWDNKRSTDVVDQGGGAVPLHVQLHARGVKAAAADFAAPHALSVVVKLLHHLLFVHAKSMNFWNSC